MTAWTVAGIGVVGITLILAALGMVSAIRQTHALAMLRIADLRHEAQSLKESLHAEVVPRLEAFLQRVAQNLRANHQADPFAGTTPPEWIHEVFLFDADISLVSLIVWRRGADGQWERWREDTGSAPSEEAGQFADVVMGHLLPPLLAARFDPHPDKLRFDYDVVNGTPYVMAHVFDAQGLHGQTLVGARMDVRRVQAQLVEANIPRDRIDVQVVVPARSGAVKRSAAWFEDLGPLAPFLWLVPDRGFVELQHSIVRRQTILLVVATFLAVAALLAVVWTMWRTFKRELALSKMKQAFVADVSHELKTPLALIRLFGETLLSDRVPTEQKRREYYEIITRESTRLTQLINSILDLARIDANKKTYCMEATDVASLVRETYETYQLQLEHEGFEHQLFIADALPEINCDRDAIAQALINLITNAMKYTHQEDKSLAIDVSAETRRGRHGVLISVSDRGIGIKPEDRGHLFTDFYRANDERVRRRRGAGLGLALVKHIVDAHGGIVDVESRLVKGSTFRIFLPACGDEARLEDTHDAQNPDRGG